MDRPRFNAWPYRDYVIKAFNDDKPYARFVQEQIAADVLFPPGDQDPRKERIGDCHDDERDNSGSPEATEQWTACDSHDHRERQRT